MTPEDKKLAEDYLFSKYPLVSPEWFKENELTQEMITMMAEYAIHYHQKKRQQELIVESFERENQQITDEDIEAWAEIYDFSYSYPSLLRKEGAIEGAKAMRDGEIKHIER